MKLMDFVRRDLVLPDMKSAAKEEAFAELTSALVDNGLLEEPHAVLEVIRRREEDGTTGIGNQVAVPHAGTALVDRIQVVVGVSKRGIEWGAFDGQPVHTIFLVLYPYQVDDPLERYWQCLEVLSSHFLCRNTLSRELRQCTTVDHVVERLQQADTINPRTAP